MKYDNNKLRFELHKLLGKYVTEIYYFDKYQGYEVPAHLPEETQYIPFSAISLNGSDFNFNISTTEYAPYFGLGGITLSSEKMMNDQRPNHIDEKRLENYKQRKVVDYKIFEGIYLKGREKIIIPNGIELSFENKSSLYILNVAIEHYNASDDTLDFVKGSELTLFFNKNIVEKFNIVKNEPIFL